MSNGLYLTTTQAGNLCGLSNQTILRWFEAGEFAGFSFKIPGSKHRRIERERFLKWMESKGIPCQEQMAAK